MDRSLISCTFVNLKPGTAKTTSSIYTAAALHRRGLSVLLVDADPAGSAQAWADAVPAGFPWITVGLPRQSIRRELPALVRQTGADAVVVDSPQLEDHARITRAAMAVTRTWIVPVAPSPIEVHRTAQVVGHMDEIAGDLEDAPDRWVLLNRTNGRRIGRKGPAADARDALEPLGLTVLDYPVEHHDTRYRQSWGTLPDPTDTAYDRLAMQLGAPPTLVAEAL
jgi:chromosome partitioning protein